MPFTNWKENKIVEDKTAGIESGMYIIGTHGLPYMSCREYVY